MASKTINNLNRMSKVFQPITNRLPTIEGKTEIISKSHKLMLDYGIIKAVTTGLYAFLPMGLRVLNKLTNLVEKEMTSIDAERLMLPALTSIKLWEKNNRYESNKDELFTVSDRHNKKYILSPVNKRIHTYEEAICDLISSTHFSTKLLPLRLYQISSKWRDEMKPRLGLLRSREFIMKDLYTFDTTLDNAESTYNLVCESYNKIFGQIGIKYVKAIGDVGTIGGLMSHEYHYLSDIGEDVVLECPSCHFFINQTIFKTRNCPECQSELHQHNAAEIGHMFLLNTKYSEPFKAMYIEKNELKPMVMGCFGLGLSRIITLVVEILSKDNEIRWPVRLAPYTACIIPPKAGSKEESASTYINQLSEILYKYNIDAILDDRTYLTIGKRFIYARALGYPYIIVIGKAANQSVPLFEIHDLNNSLYHEFSLEEINNYFSNINLLN